MTAAPDNIDKLVTMANQIGGFFKPYPEATAVEGVRDHVAKFWTKKMREAIKAASGDAAVGLDPVVRMAVAGLPDHLDPLPKPAEEA